MAKQTFTTGEVLTAGQMTSLQANDYNQTVSAKVASYTLVAADAGTRITMSNASATTITVNTSLFAAGDTLYITNIGAGACTITAGTATVSTASSLILAQYDSGVLYFTSTGVAIWQKYDGAGAAAGSMTLLSTTTLSGVSTTVSSISQSYKNLYIEWQGVTSDADSTFDIQLNAVNGSHYSNATYSAAVNWVAYRDNVMKLTNNQDAQGSSANNAGSVTVFNYASTTARKPFSFQSIFVRASTAVEGAQGAGGYNSTTAISSLKFNNVTGATFTAGTLRIYGVN